MGLLKDRYTDLYNERFYEDPGYTVYECLAEGTLRLSIRAHTLEEAEARFAEALDETEDNHPGLVLRQQWVAET
ncbi:hypothetical protein [Eubacterium sp. 1001713B170207_170306_E7]|uniref:hypothetical protein n=1 Tax=Eubacterium sp. 1001713B170207_170306_E7 TaxID=2787097 RepID=UPI00189A3EE0|nr:hypothetical protein [Eubacterium sp. 1001713B170207_170306_E7]